MKLLCCILSSILLTRGRREAQVQLIIVADTNGLLNHGALDHTEAFESSLPLAFFFP